MMRSRSRRSKSVSMLGAFMIEAGTMLAFIALAQPTWTRNLIEQVTTSPAPTSASSTFNAVANIPQATSLQPAQSQEFVSQPFVAELAESFGGPAHQALRPALLQPATQLALTAPSQLNNPTPAWSNAGWNNGAGNDTAVHSSAFNNSAVNNYSSPQSWQPTSAPTITSPSPPWSDTTERVAQASWSAPRLPASEVRYAPQVPVYPPSNWSNSY